MIIIQEKIISTQLFKKSFVCNLSKCKGACCWEGDFGAPLEDEEKLHIEDSLEDILEYLPLENRKTIKASGFFTFYPKMNANGTSLMPDNSCVFMNKDHNGIAVCGIEQAHREKDKF